MLLLMYCVWALNSGAIYEIDRVANETSDVVSKRFESVGVQKKVKDNHFIRRLSMIYDTEVFLREMDEKGKLSLRRRYFSLRSMKDKTTGLVNSVCYNSAHPTPYTPISVCLKTTNPLLLKPENVSSLQDGIDHSFSEDSGSIVEDHLKMLPLWGMENSPDAVLHNHKKTWHVYKTGNFGLCLPINLGVALGFLQSMADVASENCNFFEQLRFRIPESQIGTYRFSDDNPKIHYQVIKTSDRLRMWELVPVDVPFAWIRFAESSSKALYPLIWDIPHCFLVGKHANPEVISSEDRPIWTLCMRRDQEQTFRLNPITVKQAQSMYERFTATKIGEFLSGNSK